jgi:hypothetical protein
MKSNNISSDGGSLMSHDRLHSFRDRESKKDLMFISDIGTKERQLSYGLSKNIIGKYV